MYKEMRRKQNERDESTAWQYLNDALWGVLSLAANGLPYGVPMSHGMSTGKIYLHCALEGQKLDFLRMNPYGCYTAVPFVQSLPTKGSVAYESVVAFGKIRIVEDEAERFAAFEAINRQNGVTDADGQRFLQMWAKDALVLALDVERITAKCTRSEE